eukprot:CAMPEP_0206183980 /NCGR_PEP_ID=MMETSP0166-20121206/955_1 /ASSEMBLY_ACC=CAM_ASM_000260 /TAXON_ID=95228 /ORGANISM="Vannella robusta, Strain DIVA3 518/3/11/1/6" /LENGTH=429 /DNA_ID=CAMNT_0053598927 /DNA_START=306 /DNA_END=1596 /DNA_ORIENTATION=+
MCFNYVGTRTATKTAITDRNTESEGSVNISNGGESDITCHTKRKRLRWKKCVRTFEQKCLICEKDYCTKCLSKYRFPGDRKPPTVCKSCFPEYLHRILFPDRSYDEQREVVMVYLKQFVFSPHSEDENSTDESSGELVLSKPSTESKEGFLATHDVKPKIPMASKVLDKVAMGVLRMSGMHDGGVLNRSYVNRASRRKIKFIEAVSDIQKYTITVPYRYPTDDYEFEKYNLDPKEILEPPQEGEPETFDLVVKVFHYGKQEGELLPVVIWMHGGGFVMGDVDDSVQNRTMSRFCNCIKGVVVNVNYRLAPEFRWPTQPEDAYSVLKWVHDKGEEILGIDPKLISIGGDTGGNLANVVSIMAKERNGPKIIHQVSIYPGVHGEDTESESYRKYGNGPFLRLKLLRWFKKQFLYAPDANCGVHPVLIAAVI